MACQRQLAHVHRHFATTTQLVVSRTCQPRASRARYQLGNKESVEADLLAGLLEQARQIPVVNIPGTAPADDSQQSAGQQHRGSSEKPANRNHAGSIYESRNSSAHSCKATNRLPEQQIQQEQQQEPLHSLPQRRIRPSSMDFEAMYQQLTQWKILYLTAHVPRFCFDAPELGAWVRYMRKQHKEGLLELWKVERLNALEFEWELGDQDAKWHYKYHQLRRYLLLYGTTNVDPGSSSADYCDWMMIVRWLTKQARLLAKRKLSGQKRAMLEQLGVTLRLPKRLLHRTAQLQALNGMERRKLRKKWKAMDFKAAEQQRQQRHMEWEQRRQQQRQQQWVGSRRLALLRSSQTVDVGSDTSAAAASKAHLQQQQLAKLQDLLQQQQQQEQVLDSVSQAQEQQPRHHEQQKQQQAQHGLLLQEQQQRQREGSRGAVQLLLQPLAGQHCTAERQLQEPPSSTTDGVGNSQACAAGQSGEPSAVSATGSSTAETAGANTTAERLEAGPLQSQVQETLQQASELVPTQQQQQQEALFWQQNCRSRKVRQRSRQEKWLQVQQDAAG